MNTQPLGSVPGADSVPEPAENNEAFMQIDSQDGRTDRTTQLVAQARLPTSNGLDDSEPYRGLSSWAVEESQAETGWRER